MNAVQLQLSVVTCTLNYIVVNGSECRQADRPTGSLWDS